MGKGCVAGKRAYGQTGIRAYGQAGIRADGQTGRRAGMLSQASLKNSIENFIVPASAILASEPTGTAQGASGETTDHVTSCLRSAGIGALDEPNDATLQERLSTLNCLAFQTPHQYWLDLADDDSGTSDLDDYKEAINGDPLDQEDNGISWLSYGDLECSIPLGWVGRFFVDWGDSAAEKAACLKHDLSWGTLQAMSGDTALSESEDDSELDDAHNPRNKFLADFTFYIENVCESELGDERKQVPRQAGAPNPGLWQHLGVEER